MAKKNEVVTLTPRLTREGAVAMSKAEASGYVGVFNEQGRGRRQCESCKSFITASYRTCPVCGAKKVFQSHQAITPNVFLVVRATTSFMAGQGGDPVKAQATLEAVRYFVERVGGWEHAQAAIESYAEQAE